MKTTNQELITALTACVSRLKWHEEQLTSFPLDKVARERGEAALRGLSEEPAAPSSGVVYPGYVDRDLTQPPPHLKLFTVVTVSSNANSFGYKSVLALAEDGEGIELLVQAYGTDKVPVRGERVKRDDPRGYLEPRALPKITPAQAKKVLKEI